MVSFNENPESYNTNKMLRHLDAQIKGTIELANKLKALDRDIASSPAYLQKVSQHTHTHTHTYIHTHFHKTYIHTFCTHIREFVEIYVCDPPPLFFLWLGGGGGGGGVVVFVFWVNRPGGGCF